MKVFSATEFKASRAWGAELLGDFGEVTAKLHWTDEPYRWHRNTGPEVFVVLSGTVDMHVREGDQERTIRLGPGDGISLDTGDEHVAHPVGEARILVVERRDSE